MTHREFLEQLAEQGRVNEIIDKCLDLQKDIEALELDKENLLESLDKDKATLEHELMKAECSLHAEQNKWKDRCEHCLHTMVYDKYKSMTDYDRLIDFLKKAGIEYDTDTYTYESESGDEGIWKELVQFGKLDFEYENARGDETAETHNLICEFDGDGKFVKMYNKEED